MPDEYASAVMEAAGRIRATVPENLIEKFKKESGLSKDDFVACSSSRSGEVCAVDGSNAVLAESGSMAVVILRAAQVTFVDNERSRRSLTPLNFALIGPGQFNDDFPVLYADCFGHPPGTPLENEDRIKAAGILRDTLEYRVTEEMADALEPGSLLLRDGPLRVSHASHDTVLARITETCRVRDVGIAGVSKRTGATWGGGHPLLPSVHGLARSLDIEAPWWVRIDPALLDHAQFAQWQHGETCVACLHRKAKSPLKVEIQKDLPDFSAGEIMDRLAACSGDGRIPGYPYPLFDAHRTVVLTGEITAKVRSDLLAGLVRAGIDRQTYEILFGDYHDEFARY
jgi:hypothetical protein